MFLSVWLISCKAEDSKAGAIFVHVCRIVKGKKACDRRKRLGMGGITPAHAA